MASSKQFVLLKIMRYSHKRSILQKNICVYKIKSTFLISSTCAKIKFKYISYWITYFHTHIQKNSYLFTSQKVYYILFFNFKFLLDISPSCTIMYSIFLNFYHNYNRDLTQNMFITNLMANGQNFNVLLFNLFLLLVPVICFCYKNIPSYMKRNSRMQECILLQKSEKHKCVDPVACSQPDARDARRCTPLVPAGRRSSFVIWCRVARASLLHCWGRRARKP